MSEMFDMGGNIPSIGGPKVDPRDYETVHCSKCGSIQFVNQYVLKRVSGIEVGAGSKPMLLPLQILACAKCGAILDDDIKGYKLEKDLEVSSEKEQPNKSKFLV